MKNKIAAIALCFSQSGIAAPALADEIPPSRRATAEEMELCKEFTDFHVLSANSNGGAPSFLVLACYRAAVSEYSCGRLFKLASVSTEVRNIQGGVLNEKQAKLEEKWYAQLGMVYEENCNFGS